jgi:PfaB family protein
MKKIAIIGMSCLFPGAQTPDEFWQNLLEQKRSISELTPEQIGVDPQYFHNPEKGVPDRYYCLHGGFVRDFNFDPTGYNVPAEAIDGFDASFKWSLHVAREALRDSGYANNAEALARCGVIIGSLFVPTLLSQRLISPIYRHVLNDAMQQLLQEERFQLKDLPEDGIDPMNMYIAGYPTSLVSQALALKGPSFFVDAACASALYTVQLACDYLISGKADLMLAGAISCSDPFAVQTTFSTFKAYTDGDISRPLDRVSTGLLTGEGAGILALKRYEDAVRDGDTIYATVLGVGVSNDGKGKHFLTPSSRGQTLAFERAYADAAIDPSLISYIECHATGTELGDKTELNSMDTFLGQYGARPMIGSVKSNLGHLLTAAGLPSMVKVILSMRNGVIPPTINLREPLSSPNNVIASEQVVNKLTSWPNSQPVKHAAVSAFGFGGINAHLILEHREQHSLPQAEAEATAPTPPIPMAIVGMDAFFGECSGLDAFDRTIFQGKQHFTQLPEERWKGLESDQDLLKKYGFDNGEVPLGGYIKDFEMDFLHFKIAPVLPDQPIPQQLLLLKVADRALKDANMPEGGNVAVLVAMENDYSVHQHRSRCDLVWQIQQGLEQQGLKMDEDAIAQLIEVAGDSMHFPSQVNKFMSYIGNIMACRISAAWDFTGPSFTLACGDNSTFQALEVAQMMLTEGRVDAVVVGAVDLAGGAENMLLRQQLAKMNQGANTMGFDINVDGWSVGEGAGAIVLKRLDRAHENSDRVYAQIDAVSLLHQTPAEEPQRPSEAAIAQVCRDAFAQARVKPEDIGYLEVYGSGIAQEDTAEIRGLTQAYRTGNDDLSCCLGSVKANIGHTFTASGIASLIKSALCIYNRYIPVTPNWTAPKYPELWAESPFYVQAQSSHIWSTASAETKRIAAVNSLAFGVSYGHVILSEDLHQVKRPSNYLQQEPFHLFPLAGNDRDALFAQLTQLQSAIVVAKSLESLASHTFADFQAQGDRTHVLAIVGGSKAELEKEIQRAFKSLDKCFETGKDWQTPLGSYFSPNPLGKKGKIAFVYPGAFASYLGMGTDIFRLFPEIYEELFKFEGDQLHKLVYKNTQTLYPRRMHKLTPREMEGLEKQFSDDSIQMLIAGVIVALTGTSILRDFFKVKPEVAFGYSLGELSMIFALDVSIAVDGIIGTTSSDSLFKTRLSGPKNTIREFWGLPTSTEDATDEFWSTFAVLTSAEAVKALVDQEEKVYLTHINTPQETVIAGDRQACLRIIEQLNCDHFQIPISGILHCDPVALERQSFVELFNLPVHQQVPTQIYSAAAYGEIPHFDNHTIAETVATALAHSCDFPRLIDKTYDDGARIFIEIGPGGSCARWVKESLKGREHLAFTIDTRGVSCQTSMVRGLAKLICHQAEVDIASLYAPIKTESTKKSLVRTVSLGGIRVRDTLLTDENRQRFAGQCEPLPRPAIALPPETLHPAPIAPAAQVATLISPVQPNVQPSVQPQVQPSVQPQVQPLQPAARLAPPMDANWSDRQVTPTVSLPTSNTVVLESNVLESKLEAQSMSGGHVSRGYASGSQSGSHVGGHHPAQGDDSSPIQPTTSLAKASVAFLRSRQEGLRQMGNLIQMQFSLSEQLLDYSGDLGQFFGGDDPDAGRSGSSSSDLNASADVLPIQQPKRITRHTAPIVQTLDELLQDLEYEVDLDGDRPVVMNQRQLFEASRGSFAKAFGPEYAALDQVARCYRVPAPPYLFISRVTKVENAELGKLQDCAIETEFDIPLEAWYHQGYHVPVSVLVEASHGNIVLMNLLGIDLEHQGKLHFRALGGWGEFYAPMPKAGDRIICRVANSSFTRLGETMIFKFIYDVYANGKHIMRMNSGAGFFTPADLEQGGGVMLTAAEHKLRQNAPKQTFTPLLQSQKTSFDTADLDCLSRGDLAGCFGAHYNKNGLNPLIRLLDEPIRMLDRVVSIDNTGSAWGLGMVVGEKTLSEDEWYFRCHFQDDYCLPGSLIQEGLCQLAAFYAMYLGLQTRTQNASFQPIFNMRQTGRWRGQVLPQNNVIRYTLEVMEVGLDPVPYLKGNVFVELNGKTINILTDLGLQLLEDV